MHLAVNTRLLLRDQLEGIGVYTHQILQRVAKTHPEIKMDLFFDRPFDASFIYNENVRGQYFGPPARHPLLFYVWYQLRLKSKVNHLQPDVFFSPDSFLPLNLNCPSVITVHDVAHRRYPEYVSSAVKKYYKKNMPKFIAESDAIITVSEFSKSEILDCYNVQPDKITVVKNGVDQTYHPALQQYREEMQKRFAQGCQYFLYIGALHPRKNVATLIRAFDAFKTNHRSRIKLVIAGRKSWMYQDIEQAVATAMHRDEIIFTGYVNDMDAARLTAGALASCYVSLYEGFGMPVTEAMACGTPVICSGTTSLGEVAGDAALLVHPENKQEIAGAMEQVCTDETLRRVLSGKGIERAKGFSWSESAAGTLQVLSATAALTKI